MSPLYRGERLALMHCGPRMMKPKLLAVINVEGSALHANTNKA